MTIKQWFYKHVNITFILIVAVYFFMMWCTIYLLNADRWGFAISGGVACLGILAVMSEWWKHHQ